MFTRNYYLFSLVEKCRQRAREYVHESSQTYISRPALNVEGAAALAYLGMNDVVTSRDREESTQG